MCRVKDSGIRGTSLVYMEDMMWWLKEICFDVDWSKFVVRETCFEGNCSRL